MATGKKGTAVVANASSPLGKAFAEHLTRTGYDLVLVAPAGAEFRHRARALTEVAGRSVVALDAHLRHRPDLVRVERILRDEASVTLLVNDPGPGDGGPVTAWRDDREYEAHVVLTRLAVAALKGFASRGSGRLVNVGPTFANGDVVEREDSRAFTLSFTQALHGAHCSLGIDVGSILPALVEPSAWEVLDPYAADAPPFSSTRVDAVVVEALRVRSEATRGE